MERLYLRQTENTPLVDFHPEQDFFVLSGKSIPEDSVGFYQPVIDWLDIYVQSPNPTTVFSFKLEYFNTSSSKVLLDIFYILEKIEGIQVDWYYDEADEDMEESAHDFNEVTEFEINLIKYDN